MITKDRQPSSQWPSHTGHRETQRQHSAWALGSAEDGQKEAGLDSRTLGTASPKSSLVLGVARWSGGTAQARASCWSLQINAHDHCSIQCILCYVTGLIPWNCQLCESEGHYLCKAFCFLSFLFLRKQWQKVTNTKNRTSNYLDTIFSKVYIIISYT